MRYWEGTETGTGGCGKENTYRLVSSVNKTELGCDTKEHQDVTPTRVFGPSTSREWTGDRGPGAICPLSDW